MKNVSALETKCSEDVLMFGSVSATVARDMIDLMRKSETELTSGLDEIDRLRARLHPECHGCGLRPNLESDDTVVWCDECKR